MEMFKGLSLSPGIAEGPVFVFSRKPCCVRRYHVDSSIEECERFDKACMKAKEELARLYTKAAAEINIKEAEIFSTQIMMLEDTAFTELVYNFIADQMINAETAVAQSADELVQVISCSENDYIGSKKYDIIDITERVIRILLGIEKSEILADKPVIIAANDLHPSEIVRFDKSKILGIVLSNGKANSHTAILARSMGFPAVINTGIDIDKLIPEACGIIDGDKGIFYIEPDEDILKKLSCRCKIRLI